MFIPNEIWYVAALAFWLYIASTSEFVYLTFE